LTSILKLFLDQISNYGIINELEKDAPNWVLFRNGVKVVDYSGVPNNRGVDNSKFSDFCCPQDIYLDPP